MVGFLEPMDKKQCFREGNKIFAKSRRLWNHLAEWEMERDNLLSVLYTGGEAWSEEKTLEWKKKGK